MTYQLKSKIRRLRQEIAPEHKIGIGWMNQDDTIKYEGVTYNTLEELEQNTKHDLIYVLSFVNNKTGERFYHG